MKKILLVGLIISLILLTTQIQSQNYLADYDPDTRTITIKDQSMKDVAQIILNTALNYYVMEGKDRLVAEFTINNMKDAKYIINNMEFYDVNKGMEKVSRSFRYKYKTWNDILVYETKETCKESIVILPNGSEQITLYDCSENIIGSHIEQRNVQWHDLGRIGQSQVLPKGNITIGIFTDVFSGDMIEWIPTFYNTKIEEWAVWTASLSSGLVVYYDFNESTGSVVEDEISATHNITLYNSPTWVKGIIGNGTHFDGTNQYGEAIGSIMNISLQDNLTISMWLNVSLKKYSGVQFGTKQNNALEVRSNSEGDNTFQGGVEGVGVITTTDPTVNGEWYHLVLTVNDSTTHILYLNGIKQGSVEADLVFVANNTFYIGVNMYLDGTLNNPFNGIIDEVGIWNRTLSASEVSDLYNDGKGLTFGLIIFGVDLNSPVDDFRSVVGRNVTFNVTSTSVTGILKNVSLYVNGVFNGSEEITGSTNESIFSIRYLAGEYNWSGFVCNTAHTCVWALANRTFTTFTFLENSQTFNSNSIEGSTETFEINISYDNLTYSNSQGFLFYNGTSYTGFGITETEDTVIFTRNIQIPGMATETNFTFYWEIRLWDGSSWVFFNSTFNNQTVFKLNIDNCSTYTNRIYNFTIVDEEDQDLVSANNSIEILINIYSFDRSALVLNFSGSFNTSSINICIDRNLSNFASIYSLDSTIKYSAQDHEIEYYNIANYSLTNESEVQNIILYDLLTSDSTEFQLTFTGSDFLAVENALVFVKRQYVSENIFKTVELPKTDSNGQTILHLVRNDIVYNIEIMKNGVVIGNFENIIAFCEDVVIGNCKINLNAAESGDAIFKYDTALGITYTGPSYNNITRAITFNFLTTDGSVKTVLMNATRNDIFGNISICSTSVLSSGGTLTCQVPSYIEDSTIIAKVFVNGKETVKNYIILSEFNYGKPGYFIFFIYMLAFILMFSKSKTTMIIGIIVGFITGISLSLISGRLIGIGASGIWLVIVVILMIWKLNKERPN